MKKMNRKGFTIVELVIVIAVIAILAGVMIPTFSGIVGKAQNNSRFQEVRNGLTLYLVEKEGTIAEGTQFVYVDDVTGDDKDTLYIYDFANGTLDKTPTDTKVGKYANKVFTVPGEGDNQGETFTLIEIKDNSTALTKVFAYVAPAQDDGK